MLLPRKFGFSAASLVLGVLVIGAAGCGQVYNQKEEPPNSFELPTGTKISVRPVSDLSPADVKVGAAFAGVLADPLYYKRAKLDPDGKMYYEDVLIAPKDSVVEGKVVSMDKTTDKETAPDEDAVGLELTKITLYGGTSFDIATNRVFEFGADSGEKRAVSSAKKEDTVTFTLAKPADVALVIDLRDKEQEEAAAAKAS